MIDVSNLDGINAILYCMLCLFLFLLKIICCTEMFGQGNRFYNPKDGTYANVPFVPVHVEKFQGKRRYGTDVLIANWFEDRSKVSARY